MKIMTDIRDSTDEDDRKYYEDDIEEIFYDDDIGEEYPHQENERECYEEYLEGEKELYNQECANEDDGVKYINIEGRKGEEEDERVQKSDKKIVIGDQGIRKFIKEIAQKEKYMERKIEKMSEESEEEERVREEIISPEDGDERKDKFL